MVKRTSPCQHPYFGNFLRSRKKSKESELILRKYFKKMREIYPLMVIKGGSWPPCQQHRGLEASIEEISHCNGMPMAFLVIVWALRTHNQRKISLKSGRLMASLVMVWGFESPPTREWLYQSKRDIWPLSILMWCESPSLKCYYIFFRMRGLRPS